MTYWRHSDSEMQARADRYLRRAESGFSERTNANEFRAYLANRAYLIARLVGSVEVSGEHARITPVNPNPRQDERLEAARALYAVPAALAVASGMPAGWKPSGDVETFVTTEAGGIPVLVGIAIAVGATIAIVYCASQASQIVDRQLERNAQAQKLAQLDASAQKAIDAHVKREDQAKKALPLDEGTRAYLLELARAARELATQQQQALPDITQSAPATGLGFGIGGGAILLAAAAAVILFVKTK